MPLDIVSFDIETTNLKADFSVLLSAVIKPWGGKPIVFRADRYNPEWASNRYDDRNITKAIVDELNNHAIIVTHYGSRFDLPYIRVKASKHGVGPLPLVFGVDTWAIARSAFKLSSNRLANIAAYFGLGDKSGVEGNLWMEAGMNGSIPALDEIVAHNIQDCVLLERVAEICWPYVRSIRKM